MVYTVSNYQLTSDERSNRVVAITFNKLQDHQNKYENRKIYPYRSHYGYATFCNGSYVVQSVDLQFDRQVIYYWESPEQQIGSLLYEMQYAIVMSLKALYGAFITWIKTGVLGEVKPPPRQCIACLIDNFYVSVAPGVLYDVSVQVEPIDKGDLNTVSYRVLQLN